MDTTKTIRCAVVGVGHLGRFHAEKYARIPDARLLAVVDVDEARAKEIAELHGCDALTDHRALAGRADAASVAVPTVSHHRVAMDLLPPGSTSRGAPCLHAGGPTIS
jgi:predicted dehydrogenase